jgi:hypothetical protein
MPDYTIGIAERIASVADSTATSNSVNRNYFQETSQSVVNVVNVAITPAAPTALDPTPDTTYATATDGDSVSTFGVQETPIVITLLATIEDAGALAEYLIRSVPAFWFSNLAISLNTLSEANKDIVANLEIGQQIAVTKTFPVGVVPQSVTEVLFVEGISHRVTPETHVVTIYTGPATTYLQWLLGTFNTTTTRTNLIPNPNIETGTGGWSAAVTRSTAYSYVGSASMIVTNTASDYYGSFITPQVNVTAGLTYTFSAYGRVITGNTRGIFIVIQWLNSGGGTISQNFSPTNGISVADGWIRRTATGVAPAGAVKVNLGLASGTTGLVSGWQTAWDAILFETSSTALPYFDGTYADPYTGYTLLTQQWNGTANASSSTATWGLDSSLTGSPLNDSTYGLA